MPPRTLADNFLVPGPTAIAELIVFLLILFIFGKYIVPFVNQKLAERQELIRSQFEEAKRARDEAEAAAAEYRAQLQEIRAEATRVRERAHEEGQQIIAEMKEQARREADRIVRAAEEQIQAERARAVAAVRAEVGSLAVELASRIVGESLADVERQHRIVERFLAELEERAQRQPAASGVVGGQQREEARR
ncbi:MAG: F0F1 ATP synthase subunit B [Acidothermus cellulolyticus]|nr:F0F1 ATP synthase subunit B [Acidothermus cellulolyticus]MCL6550101.1 F0F1 ATP synthase subunit B [Acidothermus cellulolyticus]